MRTTMVPERRRCDMASRAIEGWCAGRHALNLPFNPRADKQPVPVDRHGPIAEEVL